MIKGVVFDLDDTLYLEKDYAHSGMNFIGIWLEQRWGIAGFGEELHRLWQEGVRAKTFDIGLKNLGVTLDQSQIQEMVNHYRDHSPQIFLQSDAQWILEHLQADYSLGLLTDGFEVAQRRKIEALGIKQWIPTIVMTDTLGRDCWKPSPASYELMENKLGLSGNQCVYVGDNVTKDFISARNLGWLTVQMDRIGQVHEAPEDIQDEFLADHIINNFQELPDLLR